MIDEKAQELGRLLGQSDEYKTLLRASDRMKEDATCKQLLADVERIAQEIERASQEGREPAKFPRHQSPSHRLRETIAASWWRLKSMPFQDRSDARSRPAEISMR